MLKQITPTESVVTNQIAQRLVSQIMQVAKQVDNIRSNGIPAIDAISATPEVTLPDGRKIPARPARPAVPAVSADAINAALGEDNCDLLDSIKASLL